MEAKLTEVTENQVQILVVRRGMTQCGVETAQSLQKEINGFPGPGMLSAMGKHSVSNHRQPPTVISPTENN